LTNENVPEAALEKSHVTNVSKPGLPDGIFSNQKSQFGQILEGLAMENVSLFCGHFINFPAIWYILWPFGKFCGHLYIFPRFGILHREKYGNPDLNDRKVFDTSMIKSF
jgi:hypothetical protein